MERNTPTDDMVFMMKQLVTGVEEGLALLAEHEQVNVATLLAKLEPEYGTLRVLDVRVDFEHRRQGLASAMVYQVITEARNRELRAVAVSTRTDNFPAAQFFAKCGFDLAGLDVRRLSKRVSVRFERGCGVAERCVRLRALQPRRRPVQQRDRLAQRGLLARQLSEHAQ